MPHLQGQISDLTATVILTVVLLAILAAVYNTFWVQINAFSNATGGNALAKALVTVGPILLIASVLLLFVFVYLPRLRSKGYGK